MNLRITYIFLILFSFFGASEIVCAATTYPALNGLSLTSSADASSLKVNVGAHTTSFLIDANKTGSDTVDICSGCKPTLIISIGNLYYAYAALMNTTLSSSTTYTELNNMLGYSKQTYVIDLKPYIDSYQKTSGVPAYGRSVCAFIAWSNTTSGVGSIPINSLHAFPLNSNVKGCSGGGSTLYDPTCKMTNSVDVDFGTFTSEEIENRNRIVQITSNCGDTTYATISLSNGGDSITLSNGLIASLTLDNKSMGSNMTLQKSSNSHSLAVKLSGSTSTLGSFTGSGTLSVNVQ